MTVTMTLNGKQIPMEYQWLTQTEMNNWTKVGNGNLVVTDGEYAGTYNNVPVYSYNGWYYVWPKMLFSVAAPIPGSSSSTSLGSSGTSTTTTSGASKVASIPKNVIIVGGIASAGIIGVIAYFILARRKKTQKYYGW